MKRTIFATLALLAVCAPAAAAQTTAASPAPAAPAAAAAALDPVGTFEFTTTVNGETVTGAIEITGQPGAYSGRINTENDDIPITGVTVNGQQMVIAAYTPQGELTITLNFTGNAFAGGWTLSGDGAEISGQRKP